MTVSNLGDIGALNSLLKEMYSPHRMQQLVFGDAFPLSWYLKAGPSHPLKFSRSKSRALKTRQAIAVAQDMLAECGLWPLRRAEWFPDLRSEDEKAQDIIGHGLTAWLPQSAAGRRELVAKLTEAGLMQTEVAQRLLGNPPTEADFYGVDFYGVARNVGARLAEPITFSPAFDADGNVK